MFSRLLELAALFLKLGTIGFGGPAVHIATMEDEVVTRRGWLSREHFLDLIGATNLIPGPNSTEMAIHIGYVRAGLLGLITAGLCFVLPAVTITTFFAWLYVEYGELPQLSPVLQGIKPAVLAIILTAGWRLAQKAIKTWPAGVLATVVAASSFFLADKFLLIIGSAVFGMFWLSLTDRKGGGPPSSGKGKVAALLVSITAAFRPNICQASTAALAPVAALAAKASLPTLGGLAFFFLKVGAVLYGTGYVLIAYLEGGLVDDYGWLTHAQLADAIAIGQFTPGPILSTAAFVGYVVIGAPGQFGLGLLGAIVASACIFLPSFFFVAVTNPIIPRLRKNRLAGLFLDSVNAASMGLMAAVTIDLGRQIFVPSLRPLAIQWTSVLIAVIAIVVALRWRVSSFWLVLGGAVAGFALWSIGWISYE